MKRIILKLLCLSGGCFLCSLYFLVQRGYSIDTGDVLDILLLEKIKTNKASDKIPIFILFKKQGSEQEFSILSGGLKIAQRREKVISWLKNLSEANFREFNDWINKNRLTSEIMLNRRYWLLNGLEATASLQAIHKISSRPGITKIYLRPQKPPDFIKKAKKLANLTIKEPFKQPGFKGPFSTEGKQIGWNLRRIRAPEVWKQGYTGRGVIVAVLDGGMNYFHPDIKNNLWVNEKEIPENGKDDDNDGYVDDYLGWNFAEDNQNIEDLTSHGTGCSGIVCGDGTAGTITGVAPQASLMVLKYYTRYNNEEYAFRDLWKASQFDAWLALQYALDHGAQVASLSVAYDQEDDPPYAAWRFAVANASSCGLAIIASAGNERERYKQFDQINIPGNIPEAITVGGFGENDSLISYSSLGPVTWESITPFKDFPLPAGLIKPDVCAPVEGFPDLSYVSYGYDYPGGGGTSSACPHVAGVVALMLEKDPELMPWEIKKRLEETCIDTGTPGKDNLYGAGRVDAWEVVNYGISPNISLPDVKIGDNKNLYIKPGQNLEIKFFFHASACPFSKINAVLYSPIKELKILDEAQNLTLPKSLENNQTFQLVFRAKASESCPEHRKVALNLILNAEIGRKFFFQVPVYIGHSNLLVVDDDGQGESEKAVLDALDHAERDYNYVNTQNIELNEEMLEGYKHIIWLTGEEFHNTVDIHEQALLKRYLDGGGNLMLFGEHIGKEIGKTAFYDKYLHARVVKDSLGDVRKENPFIIYGKKDDLISNRLTLKIDGYYRHNQIDIIRPLEGADDPFLGEAEKEYVGVVRYSGNYKLVYASLAIGLIKDIGTRAELLERILDWFEK